MQKLACIVFFSSLLLFCSVSSSKLRIKKQYDQQVVNGDFDQKQVGWNSPDFEHADNRKGFNTHFAGSDKDAATELDAWKGNSYIEQIFKSLHKGTYLLKFEFAAREGWALETSKLEVQWNGKDVLPEYTPASLDIKKFKFEVQAVDGENSVKFIAKGASDGVGAIIDKVSLKAKELEEIVNGGFDDDGKGWVSDDIEIQDSKLYIANWESGKVCELDAWKGNTSMKQTFKLEIDSTLVLRFDYNARPDYAFDSNIFSITFNGQVVFRITPTDYKTHSVKLYLNGLEGNNTIILKGEGKDDGVGMLVDNISAKTYAHELIVNGSFENSTNGWTGSGKIEIGDGNYYNDNFNTKKAAELDAWENITLSQVFNVDEDTTLACSFDGAARKGVDLSSNQAQVYINDVLYEDIKPENYNLHHFMFFADVKDGDNTIKFVGTGTNDTVGYVIDNVSCRRRHEAVGDELVHNGGFDDKGEGWTSNDIEVLDAKTYYNDKFTTGNATELDSHENVEVSTTVHVAVEGFYEFKFDGAARTSVAFDSNKAIVKVDAETVLKIAPNDYDIHHFDLAAYFTKGDHVISFIGDGKSDTVGYIIDNVSVKLLIPNDK